MGTMTLTRDDLLIAAARADRYPAGYGFDWGYGPFVLLEDWERLSEYG